MAENKMVTMVEINGVRYRPEDVEQTKPAPKQTKPAPKQTKPAPASE